MSEVLRSVRYYGPRVLIETARVLDPQFADGVLHITGAEFELLRNLTTYLHRQSTFVSEYRDVDYLTPTVSDWDSLEAVIANLEEKLMGNENTIWGYNDAYNERVLDNDVAAGTLLVSFSSPPPGEVWVLTSMAARGAQANYTSTRFMLSSGGNFHEFWYGENPGAVVPVVWGGVLIVKPTSFVRVYYYDAQVGDDFVTVALGYKMKIPV